MRNSSLQDVSRMEYLHGNIGGVLDAIRSSFGLYYVDKDDPELKRYPKLYAKWYSWVLTGTIKPEKDSSFDYDGRCVHNLPNHGFQCYKRFMVVEAEPNLSIHSNVQWKLGNEEVLKKKYNSFL
ncbi:hypothetical protein JHK87_005102 [Glycine soja]|nr:hypothetical protein JHK87_005102 [Glycine soja]